MRMMTTVFAILILAACGGGGGGGGPTTGVPSGPAVPPAPSSPPTPSASTTQDESLSSTAMVASDAAGSLPVFGSVSQSASRDGVTGISTDHASTSFNGSDFTLRVSRARGNDIHLSTRDDIAGGYELGGTPISGHDRAAEGYILDYKPTETTASYVAVSWLNSDHTDYLAGGYWLHWDGDILGSNFTADDAGAFVDGPELSMSNRPNIDSLQGSATYRGAAEGLYAAEYGSDFPQYEDEIGIWQGDLRLTANFGAQTIGGCVGCSAPMLVNGSNEDFRIQLGSVPIASNGTFRGPGESRDASHPHETCSIKRCYILGKVLKPKASREMVRSRRLELPRAYRPQRPQRCASTNSATTASRLLTGRVAGIEAPGYQIGPG